MNVLFLLAACGSPPPAPAPRAYDQLPRADFNRLAVRLDLPVYWVADTDGDGAIDPEETASLLFYPSTGAWVENGAFTPAFTTAYDALLAARSAPAPTDDRLRLVLADLDAGRPTLQRTDLRGLAPDEKDFVRHVLAASTAIDALYDLAAGNTALATQVPQDPASRSLFRRNRGPRCQAPATEREAACSAIPGAPKPIVAVYPAEIQSDPAFCEKLEARADAAGLLGPFSVVRADGKGGFAAVPYHEAWPAEVRAVVTELRAASAAIAKVQGEAPLVAYLDAAATAFETDDWQPADEAWSKMNAENSKWYLRVGPDETYWEPCAQKAGYHLTFARIDRASLDWQRKLAPYLQEMEHASAEAAGAPYTERTVAFHLPDFIDIVVNAGDDRTPFGATLGQSLPNWGPVADEGRGRTVAMSTLYTDPDSREAHRAQAASLLDASSMAAYTDDREPSLLNTILHEASHNLGPSAEYRVNGKTDEEAFGGQLAAMLEELKAETGDLFLVERLRQKGVLSDERARQVYLDAIVWAFGHVAEGMYEPDGSRKPYPQLAAVQLGILMDEGALVWDPGAAAANGTDHGAFVVKYDMLVPAVDAMMRRVAGIKARADKAAADEMSARYVDGAVVPMPVIAERYARVPRASFVYAVEFD